MPNNDLTLADLAKEMRERASFGDLSIWTIDLLETWADAIDRLNAAMQAEIERLRAYQADTQALLDEARQLDYRKPAGW